MQAQAKCTDPAVHTSSSPHPEIICQVISWLRLSAGHYIFVRKLFFSQLCAESSCTCVIDNKGMSSGPAQGQVFTQGRKSDVISPCIVCFQHTNSEHCFHFHLMDTVSLFSGELVHGFGSWRTYRTNNNVCLQYLLGRKLQPRVANIQFNFLGRVGCLSCNNNTFANIRLETYCTCLASD